MSKLFKAIKKLAVTLIIAPFVFLLIAQIGKATAQRNLAKTIVLTNALALLVALP